MASYISDCCVGMGRFLAFLSFLAFGINILALSVPFWLKKEYKVPSPAMAAVLGVPVSEVESNIGVLYACTDTNIPVLGQDEHKCESLADVDTDLVADWQWACAGMGIASLVLTFLCFVMTSCVSCRRERDAKARATVTTFYIIASILFIAIVLLFNENTSILVSKQLNIEIDYDFDWGFYVGIGCAGYFMFLGLAHLMVICRLSGGTHA